MALQKLGLIFTHIGVALIFFNFGHSVARVGLEDAIQEVKWVGLVTVVSLLLIAFFFRRRPRKGQLSPEVFRALKASGRYR